MANRNKTDVGVNLATAERLARTLESVLAALREREEAAPAGKRYGKYSRSIGLHKPTSRRALPARMANPTLVAKAFERAGHKLNPLEREAVRLRFGLRRASGVGRPPLPKQAYAVAQRLGLPHKVAQLVTRQAVTKLGVIPNWMDR